MITALNNTDKVTDKTRSCATNYSVGLLVNTRWPKLTSS